MAGNNHAHNREFQQDARAWAAFTGTKYTAAVRQMSSPLAQGLLGERISARLLIDALEAHDLIGAGGGDHRLGENGYMDSSWHFNGQTDFIELALITESLRMLTPIAESATPEVSSYSLKHTVELFLSPHCSYVSNGRLIWAAAALGLRLAAPDGRRPNLLVAVSVREHDYVRRMVDPGRIQPRAHHHQPAGYAHLRAALDRYAVGESVGDRWVPSAPSHEVAPFHDWLILQTGRSDEVGHLASDYAAGVRESDHGPARAADDLLVIFREILPSPEVYDATVRTIAEWMRTSPSPGPIRTERIGGDSFDHAGWGAGSGSVERIEYHCPCRGGTIVEEHDDVPGFREHDVWIACDKCRSRWRFIDGRSVRGWGLEPMTAVGTS
jgi:hypothetical protein